MTFMRGSPFQRYVSLIISLLSLCICYRFAWHGAGSKEGYSGGFCEKLREASPVSDKASVSRL